jgi:polyisoprenoid-binding protein YceI
VFSRLNLKPVHLLFLWLLGTLLLAACSGSAAPIARPIPVEEPMETPLPSEEPGATATAPPTTEADTADSGMSGVHTYVIVSEESKASYVVDEQFFEDALGKYGIQAGLTDTIGSTQEVEGELQLNLDDLSAPLGVNRFTVNLATLTSDQPLRDRWIHQNGPQFSNFPTAEFTGTAIEGAPNNYAAGDEVQFKLTGDLTIREITQPVTFDVTAKLEADTITGVATAQLLMTDFGIDPPNFANTLSVENEFEVIVEFTAQEQ